MAERRVTVQTEAGLHARPAALFVQAATKVPMDVVVGRPDTDPVNAKSILSVIGLDVRHGEEIVISAEGDGAETALDQLAATVAPNGV
jgi:phosphocarrier protein HPr